MRSRQEYMDEAGLDEEGVLDFALDLSGEKECPCGWSWEIECDLDCPLRGHDGIRSVDDRGIRHECIFDPMKMSDDERLFLARTWIAVQLMAREFKPV